MHQHVSAPAREHQKTLRSKSIALSEIGAANIIGQVLHACNIYSSAGNDFAWPEDGIILK